MVTVNDRLLGELKEAAALCTSAGQLAEALSSAIRPVIAHDALRLVATSPNAGSVLWSFGFWHAYEPDFCRALLRTDYAGGDTYLPDDPARRPMVTVLPGNGDAPHDRAARRLAAEHGIAAEMRLMLRDVHGLWGQVGLVRAEGGRSFDEADVGWATRLVPRLIGFLRSYVTAGPLAPPVPSPPPGVIIVGPDQAIRTATPEAFRWREQLEKHARAPRWTRESFTAGLAEQTRRHARDPRAVPPLIVGPSATYGRWVAAHGQILKGTDDVALIIQAASAEQLLPAFCDWYGISARERQIITHLREARAPKQIARYLDLSVHTVNDHLKAVFRKTGASGRDELLAAFS
ncbi:helix-turn-helix transcriptional regulator [Actinomadura sp. KC216]|uniref:helix-turn-helix transcriptional regulator n=1 Tax=Actinomadura sp. KC216 TaxID=2530370 RepID=UPI001A9D1789|nr:helix-turn-helix transcriptional regulator [Actinomadura sp. KC216]